MAKNILLILGHPSENSFCNALLDAYRNGAASAGAHCKMLYLSRLNFNVNLADGYKTGETMQLEEDLATAQQLIQWADHIVLAYPNWWGFMPALTKGFIDRIFLVFGYVGFDPIRFSTFGFIRKATDQQRTRWLTQVKQLGQTVK